MTLSLPADADVSCGLPTATVVLKPKRARPFFGRHPWVLDSALLRVDGKPADGDVVDLTTHDGLFVARGLWNGASKIRVRLYAFNAATKLDTALWRSRLEAAAALRRSLGLDDRGGGCRLVNSEGDDLSGLIVDRYGDWLAGQVTALAKANTELNGAATITVETADAFKKLDALEAVGEPFGMVILDPPKFGCSRASLEEAMRAYHRINRLAVDLLEPGGILVINSCSGAVGRDDFLMMLAGVAQRSGQAAWRCRRPRPAANRDRRGRRQGQPGQWHFRQRCPTAERLVSRLLPRPEAAPARKAFPGSPAFPSGMAFFPGRRGTSPNPAAWRLRGDLASGSGRRLWMSIAGSSSIRRLKDVAVVMRLDELALVGGRPASGRDGRRFERFAEVGENLPDRSGGP